MSVAADDDAPEAAAVPTASPKKKPRACERCGTFAKRTKVFGARVCADCAERVVHPAARGPLRTLSVLGGALSLWADVGFAVVPVPLVVYLASAAIQGTERDPTMLFVRALMTMLFQLVVGTFATGVILRLGWAAMQREPTTLRHAVSASATGYLALLSTSVRVFFSVWARTFLLFVPGLLRLLDTTLAPALTVLDETPPALALNASADRSRGIRGVVLGTMLAAYAVLLVPAFALTATAPLLATTVSWRITAGILSTLAHIAATLVAVVLYARTRLVRGV